VATFDDQRDAAREQDALALTESREHHTHAILFGDVLPRLQAYSFVTLLTVIFESRLSVFCRTLSVEHDLPRSLDDFDGDFLEQSWAYLTEQVQARPPTELWRWMQDVFTLRGCIVNHAGNVGTLDQSSRRAVEQIERRRPGVGIESDEMLFNSAPHATLRSEYVLEVQSEFCLEAVTAAQGLFGYLYQHKTPGEP
jgi:hypothetical protein